MTDIFLELPADPDPRDRLAQSWRHHVDRARGERPSALSFLRRLEAALEQQVGGGRWLRSVTLPSVAMPRLRVPTLRVPTLRVPGVSLPALDPARQAKLASALLVMAIALASLGGARVAKVNLFEHSFVDVASGGVASGGSGPLTPEHRAALSSLLGRMPSPVETASKPVAPVPPTLRGALPFGKGMWLWRPESIEGGNPEAVVIRAKQAGLTHIYVRTGSSKMGFYSQQYLNDLLPRAHAAGLRVFGWDFPYLFDVPGDVARAVAAITYTTPTGHRIDGFSPDIETRGEGVNIAPHTAGIYSALLRKAVGSAYPLIVTVPRPSPALTTYPFDHILPHYDAVAPMVYWLNREPGGDVAAAIAYLRQFGKPVMPVGQAYDGFGEGGRPGVPPRHELQRFMKVADEHGAISVSFWSWQHAGQEAWDAIRDAPEFTVPVTPPGATVGFTPGQIRMYQGLLTSLGFPAPFTGRWDEATQKALRAYQQAARLPATGVVDHATRAVLLTPFLAPISPLP